MRDREAPMSDLEIIVDENMWPQWPFLPMRNRKIKASTNPQLPRVGILTYQNGTLGVKAPTFLFADEVNMFDMEALAKAEWKPVKINELLAAGWEVD